MMCVFLSADADGVYTVSKVAVQSGKSVTIPCVYDREYDYHVKYWCHGSNWNFCKTVVRTDSPKRTGKTSITDDPTHHVFTVNMTMLTTWDSGYYWCVVEIQRGGDKGAYLNLSVIADTPGLWVEQQEVAGVEGGHVSVPCQYNEPSSMKKWCRIKGSCLEVNSGESGRSEMKDDHSKKVFTVRELNMEDTGWYWCAAGELQIPVHLTVTQKTTTTTVTTRAHQC
ncbi:polymeric immunoglobulin receptor-like [Conger conger]|uniref:polymeric immunoglobulin receptor-like n=1 Tax=Conger conger TaxID=82655 RepID=UPI002A5A6756|nr:polymeric immunoglobulin receptor-like [Conger conger]